MMQPINFICFKVTEGLAFEVCKKHMDTIKEVEAEVYKMAAKHGAKIGPYQSINGIKVNGFAFSTRPPRGWRPSAHNQGYWVADKKNKAGKEIAAEFEALPTLPYNETLANDLGVPNFFTDLDTGGKFCGTVEIFEYLMGYYLETCKWARPNLERFPSITPIERSEFEKAREDKRKMKVVSG